jgi:serine acetyltransferase
VDVKTKQTLQTRYYFTRFVYHTILKSRMKSYTYLCDGETISIPIPEDYIDCLQLAKSDYRHYAGQDIRTWRMLLSTGMPAFYLWFRLSTLRTGRFHKLCAKIFEHYQRKFRIFISPRAKIGAGLSVARGVHILSAPTVNIGNNVRLSRYTIIGKHKNAVVSIGNNVCIGSYGTIIDDNEIACGSTLQPCSFVTPHRITAALL